MPVGGILHAVPYIVRTRSFRSAAKPGGGCPPPEELLICCAGPLRDMLTRGKGGADSSKDKGPSDGGTCLEPPHPPHHARAATPPPQRHPLMLFVRAPICLPLCACAGEKGEKGGADSSEDKETPEIGSDGRSDGIGVNPDDVSTPLGSKSAGAADPGPGPVQCSFAWSALRPRRSSWHSGPLLSRRTGRTAGWRSCW